MKKKILVALIAFVMVITLMPLSTAEASTTYMPSVTAKSVYKISKYRSGDCLLCANAYMIKRLELMLESPKWNYTTNTTLRGSATIGGCTSLLKWSYTYRNPKSHLKFKVKSYSFSGSRTAKLKALLKEHPEGIAVYGRGTSGPHAVIITGYNKEKGYFYCVDSTHNIKGKNRGIESYERSTMKSLGSLSRYWIIEKVTLPTKDAPKVVASKVKKEAVYVSWGYSYGQNRVLISKSEKSGETHTWGAVDSPRGNGKRLAAKPGKKMYYKVRASHKLTYKDYNGKEHTKFFYGPYSEETKFKL